MNTITKNSLISACLLIILLLIIRLTYFSYNLYNSSNNSSNSNTKITEDFINYNNAVDLLSKKKSNEIVDNINLLNNKSIVKNWSTKLSNIQTNNIKLNQLLFINQIY